MMKRRKALKNLMLFNLTLLLASSCQNQRQQQPQKKYRILFIGNSYIYYNELPKLFASLSEAGKHPVEVDMLVQGGWTLAQHNASKETETKLLEKPWNFVVLQEQSVIPSLEKESTELMYPAARYLATKIQTRGAKTVLFMTWGRRNGLPDVGHANFDGMQSKLSASYMRIASELEAPVAPVGIAWQRAFQQNPSLELWDTDGSHPSLAGSYLAACVFYAVFYKQSPEGLNYTASLPKEATQFLQKVAAETVLNNSQEWNI